MTTTTPIGPCENEGATNCYWNAPTMGNAEGSSFIAIGDTITYIEGCEVGEGLPAVDIDAITGTPWAYCEPALGNDVAPAVEASTYTPGETLAATGPADMITADLALGAAILVTLGIAAIRKAI